MKEFIIGEGKEGFKINLPTKLSEITEDYLKGVTDNIIIAPYYAVIATVYRCKLPEVISSNKKSRAMAIAIVPIFVKANLNGKIEDGLLEVFNNLKCGDKIVICGSDIERGYHLSVPNNFITLDNIVKIYNEDEGFAKVVMPDQNYYYFVDFKLVPINDIKGKYSSAKPADFINPFIIRNINEIGN